MFYQKNVQQTVNGAETFYEVLGGAYMCFIKNQSENNPYVHGFIQIRCNFFLFVFNREDK